MGRTLRSPTTPSQQLKQPLGCSWAPPSSFLTRGIPQLAPTTPKTPFLGALRPRKAPRVQLVPTPGNPPVGHCGTLQRRPQSPAHPARLLVFFSPIFPQKKPPAMPQRRDVNTLKIRLQHPRQDPSPSPLPPPSQLLSPSAPAPLSLPPLCLRDTHNSPVKYIQCKYIKSRRLPAAYVFMK